MTTQGLTALLSHVVEYQKVLERVKTLINTGSGHDPRWQLLNDWRHLHPDFSQVLSQYHQADQMFAQQIDAALAQNTARIAEMAQRYHAKSQDIAHRAQPHSGDRWPTNDLTRNLVKNKCQGHSSWQWPGLVFRPQVCDFLRSLVACDPLYVCDQNHEYIHSVRNRFPVEYQQRLRYYTIDERETEILAHLPQGNFGFVAAFDFFTVKTLDVCARYFREIWHLLRPGGVLGFSFNDCDHSHEITRVESGLACYTPGHEVKQILRSCGYDVILQHRDLSGSSWWEARRPGQLQSTRGSQTLARIFSI